MSPDRSNVILQGVVGSQAYGLANEDSDEDRLGIYVAPLEYTLGLNGSGDLVDGPQSVADSLVTHEPDVTLHEVGKYVRLALSANPTILELLYLPEHETSTPTGEMLVQERDRFLCAEQVRLRYGGYAKGQAERLLRRTAEGKEGFSSDVKARTAKHGRHCARLLLQGAQLLREGTMTVNVAEHRDYLYSAGNWAQVDPQGFYYEAMSKLAELDEIESVLPDMPDREYVNSMLVAIRLFEGESRIEAMTGMRHVGIVS